MTKFENAYVQKVHDDTQRCLSELRGQNERLRLQVAALESDRNHLQQEKLRLQSQLIAAREELATRHDEHTALVRRLTEAEAESERVATQFVDIEAQNTNLANLYVAGFQLRASLKRGEVLSAIKEIIVNLIGCEHFAIFERVAGKDALVLVDSFDDNRPHIAQEIGFGDGIIGSVAASGESYIASGDRSRLSGMTACIALKVDREVVGAIAMFELLPQKSSSLDAVDYELFDLLGVQAGVALYCSRLTEQLRSA